MNILKITQKIYHEVTVDEVEVTMAFSSYYTRIGNIWYNRHRDGDLIPVSGSLERMLEEQFHDMNGVMHEQMELYEDDYSRLPINQRPIHTDKSFGPLWVGAYTDSLRYGPRSG